MGIITLHSLQMQVLLENMSKFLLVRIAGIIGVAGIIRGRALHEEILYLSYIAHLFRLKYLSVLFVLNCYEINYL